MLLTLGSSSCGIRAQIKRHTLGVDDCGYVPYVHIGSTPTKRHAGGESCLWGWDDVMDVNLFRHVRAAVAGVI